MTYRGLNKARMGALMSNSHKIETKLTGTKRSRPSTERTPPSQFNTIDLGSPKKIWSLMYEKDEVYSRDETLFQQHPNLKKRMRSVVLEWLMEVSTDKMLNRETFYLCMDYFDRYLKSTEDLDSNKLQLIGSTALFIASKIEEIYPPKLCEIADYTDGSCKSDDIKEFEEIMLHQLNWNLTPITAIHWLSLYLQLMNIDEPIPDFTAAIHECIKKEQSVYQHPQCFEQLTPHRNVPRSHYSLFVSPQTEVSEDSAIAVTSSSGSSHTTTEGIVEQIRDYHMTSFSSREVDLANNSFFGGEQTSFNTSFGHSFFQHRVSIPKLMRDEFVRLSSILDMSMLDSESLNFRYSELAAALILCSYEPESLIYKITDFFPHELEEARRFMEPFVKVAGLLSPAGTIIPCISTVLPRERHNIQTHTKGILECMDKANEIRRIMELERKKAEEEEEIESLRLKTSERSKRSKRKPSNGSCTQIASPPQKRKFGAESNGNHHHSSSYSPQ